MPFGLVSAPATFARMMRLLKLEEVSSVNFFDDILTKSRTWNEHLVNVRGVLSKLRDAGLTARPSKIYAGCQELEFLGHIVGRGKLKPEAQKVKKILALEIPKSKRQIRALMGLISYYRRYVQNFAAVTKPLTDLIKSGAHKRIIWTKDCADALRVVQQVLSSSPVLVLPDISRPFTVRTDASSFGIGAVLFQTHNGDLHPVTCVSRKLLDRETRYSTIERECLAIVWALTKLSKYLWGRKFDLETDHKPLVYLRSSQFKNSRITRWALALQEFHFEIKPLPGHVNMFADALSRSNVDQSVP
jgi:hypothetical protein